MTMKKFSIEHSFFCHNDLSARKTKEKIIKIIKVYFVGQLFINFCLGKSSNLTENRKISVNFYKTEKSCYNLRLKRQCLNMIAFVTRYELSLR